MWVMVHPVIFLLLKNKKLFLTYCSNVLKAANGTGIFSENAKKVFEQKDD